MSIKRSLDLRNENQNICKKWYTAIQYLIKKVKSMSEVRKKKLKELSNRKEIISDFWRTEILPNWSEYRKFLIFKGTSGQIQFFHNEDLYNYKKKLQKFKSTLTLKDDNEKEKQNVIYLWTLGIPDWLRKKLWSLVIGNDLEINENLFNFYLKLNEQIEFQEDTAFDRKKFEETPGYNEEPNIVGEFEGIPVLETNKMIETSYNNIDNPVLNEIILDVHKSYKKFIKNIKTEEKKFKEDLFKVLRAFNNYRPDIPFSRSIAYISTVLYLNSEDFYLTFINLCNFIIPSFLRNFLIKDELYIKGRLQFFESLIKIKVPEIYHHFKNLDITLRLFFYEWIEFLFAK
jgi:hypothetical protein